MTPLFPCIPVNPPGPASDLRTLALQSFTYEARRVILPALSEALSQCGCWLSERKVSSTSQIEFIFELQHRLVLDLYSALVGAGLQLTRGSHLDLTALCTLLRHSLIAGDHRRVIQVCLDVSFLDELDLQSIIMPGAALA